MKNPLIGFLLREGVIFQVFREDQLISEEKGLINSDQRTLEKFVSFLMESDIRVGDVLITKEGNEFFVSEVTVQYWRGEPFEKRAIYQTSVERDRDKTQQPVPQFHVENAYGSVIGTQSNFTLNYQNSLSELKSLVDNSESQDQSELKELILLLEMMLEEKVPVQKGFLSKFSELLKRNSWITGPIASTILNWLTTQVL